MKSSLIKFTSVTMLGIAACYLIVKMANRKKKTESRGAWTDCLR